MRMLAVRGIATVRPMVHIAPKQTKKSSTA